MKIKICILIIFKIMDEFDIDQKSNISWALKVKVNSKIMQ